MSGITRIELLILLFIGGIVTATGIPLVLSAREAARQGSCRNNLKQIGLALANYRDIYKHFPPGCQGNSNFAPSRRWSWQIALGPLYEGGRPADRVDFALPSDRIENLPKPFEYVGKDGETRTWHFPRFSLAACPNSSSAVDEAQHPLATYVGMAGVGREAATLPLTNPRAGMWGYDRVTTLDDVKKTKDATIHVIETASDRGSWYRGGPATVRGFVPGGKTPIGKNGQFGGYHPGLAMTLFADGRVQPLSEKTEESVFAGMATITAEK